MIPAKWKKNENIKNRENGLPYCGTVQRPISSNNENNAKWNYDVQKGKRELKDRCLHLGNSSVRCANFSDEARKSIFDKFWNLSWSEKRFFVCQHIQVQPVKRPRHRQDANQSRRSETFRYTFQLNGIQEHVCKKFFLNTLDLKETSVYTWKKEQMKDQVSPPNKISRTPNERIKKSVAERRLHLNEFLESLPRIESHYCRKDTKGREFLEPMWSSKNDLYHFYKQRCEEDSGDP